MSVHLSAWLEACRWKNLVTSLVAALCIFFAFNYLYEQHHTDLPKYGDNVWFQGDIGRVYGNMNNRLAFGHYRTKVHPLHSLQTYPPTFVLKNILSSDAKAIKYVTVSIAVTWLYCLYFLLRRIGCARLDALLFSFLGAGSSAALFWLSVPETYALGSISIIFALWLAAAGEQQKVNVWKHTMVNAFTFSVTVTNWMAGLLSTFTSLSFKQAVRITAIALLAVSILWCLQKLIFPASQFFIGNSEESKYLFTLTFDRVTTVFHTFFFHTTITPTLNITQYNLYGWPMISMQSSAIGSSGVLGKFATCIWAAMLGLGLWALITHPFGKALKLTLGLTLLGQFGLHSLYGEETFLYSMHFLPLLIVLTALTTQTHFRKPVLALMLILIPCMLINNMNQFYQATETFKPYQHYSNDHNP